MLELEESGEFVVYASSFSKTLCPGIRVGYLVGPVGLIKSIRKRANLHLTQHGRQSIVAEFCHSGAIDESIAVVKEALRERRDATCDALGRHLPEAAFVTPEGGYFLWVDLPEGSDVAALEHGACERGVVFVKGTDFLLKGGRTRCACLLRRASPTR